MLAPLHAWIRIREGTHGAEEGQRTGNRNRDEDEDRVELEDESLMNTHTHNMRMQGKRTSAPTNQGSSHQLLMSSDSCLSLPVSSLLAKIFNFLLRR
jgi:hypothetical protein